MQEALNEPIITLVKHLQLFLPPPLLQFLILQTPAYLLDECFRSCNKQLHRPTWQACDSQTLA
jgi:hypothetical protein